MDSGFKYPDGDPIYNGDMFQFKDGDIGFVWYSEVTDIWSVKYHSAESEKNCIMSLSGAHQYIERFLI